jgi:hypothetical protein
MPETFIVEKVRALVLEIIEDWQQSLEPPYALGKFDSRLLPDIDQLLAGVQPMIDKLNKAVSLGNSYDDLVWLAEREIINLFARVGYPRYVMEQYVRAFNLGRRLKKD